LLNTSSDFSSLQTFVIERTVYDLISETMAAWTTGVLATQDEVKLIQICNKFISDSEKTLQMFKNNKCYAKLLYARSRELATQALETLGLAEDNRNLNLRGAVGLLKTKLGPSDLWSQVEEFEEVLCRVKLEISEAVTWAKQHEQIPLRLLAVILTKKFNGDDPQVQIAFEELEAFFSF